MSPEKRDGNVRDYCDDFTFQAVQELLQFALVACHLDIESVHPVFHLPNSFMDSPFDLHCRLTIKCMKYTMYNQLWFNYSRNQKNSTGGACEFNAMSIVHREPLAFLHHPNRQPYR